MQGWQKDQEHSQIFENLAESVPSDLEECLNRKRKLMNYETIAFNALITFILMDSW